MDRPSADAAASPINKRAIGSLALLTFSLKVGGAGLGFILNVVLARAMGAEGFGIYLIAFTAASIISVFATAGITFSAVRFVPQYIVQADWSAVRGFFRMGNIFTLVGATVTVAGSVLVIISYRPEFEPELKQGLLLGVIAIPLITSLQTLVSYLQALGRILASEVVSNIVRPVITIVMVLLLAFALDRQVWSSEALAVTLIAFAIATFLSWLVFRQARPAEVLATQPTYQHRVWLGAGLSMMLILTGAVLNERLDIVMVGALLGSEPAGIYGAASRAALAIGLALSAVNVFLMRQLSAAYAERDMQKLQALAVFGAWVAFVISLLVGAVLMLLADFVLGLFGEAFRAGKETLILLIVAQWGIAAFGASGGLAVVVGGQRLVVSAMLLGLLCNVVLNYSLVPVFGITGAALATLLAILISQAIIAGWCRLKLGFSPSILGGLPWKSPGDARAG